MRTLPHSHDRPRRPGPRRGLACALALVLGCLLAPQSGRAADPSAAPAAPLPPDDLHEIAPIRPGGADLPRAAEDGPGGATVGQPAVAPRDPRRLTLEECRARALASNLDLQVQLVEPRVAAQRVSEEEARFEAAFVGTLTWAEVDSPGAATPVDETEARAGVEVPLQTGGTVTVGFADVRTRVDTADLEASSSAPVFTFSVSQPLLRSAGRRANTHAIRVAGLERRMSEARTRLEVTRVLAMVDRAYWRLYAARREVDVRRMERDLAQTQLANARRLLAAGETPELEVVRAETAVAEREEAILVAEIEVRTRDRDLARILNPGVAPALTGQDIIAATEPDPVRYAPAAARLVELALASRMELLEQELRIVSDASTVDYLRNAALPLVALEYNYNVNGLGESREDAYELLNRREYEGHRVGLVVRIPLGNRAARSRLLQALERRRQDLATLEGRRLLVRTEVHDALDRVELGWQRIMANRQRALLSARLLAAEERQFGIGLHTSTDVLTAQAKLADAQSAEVSSLTEYQIAMVDLCYATGTVLGAARVRWDEAP